MADGSFGAGAKGAVAGLANRFCNPFVFIPENAESRKMLNI
jgi:hypothetical protein